MNLKDLFRKKNIVNLKDTTNVKEKELIRKISRVGNIRLKLTAKSKFKLSENWGAVPPTITFELVDYPGHVMRARSLELFGEKKRDDESFGKFYDSLLGDKSVHSTEFHYPPLSMMLGICLFLSSSHLFSLKIFYID